MELEKKRSLSPGSADAAAVKSSHGSVDFSCATVFRGKANLPGPTSIKQTKSVACICKVSATGFPKASSEVSNVVSYYQQMIKATKV